MTQRGSLENPGGTGGLSASGVSPWNTGGQAASATLNRPDTHKNKVPGSESGEHENANTPARGRTGALCMKPVRLSRD